MCKSVERYLLDKLTLRSRNGILVLLDSYVNLREDLHLLSSSRNESSFSGPWVQKKTHHLYNEIKLKTSFPVSQEN